MVTMSQRSVGSILVLSGGPCSGKTTLLRALRAKGYAVIEEAASSVLRDRYLSPSADPLGFQREVLRRQLLLESEAQGELAFADRSVADNFACLEHIESTVGRNPPIASFRIALEEAWRDALPRYRKVFLLEQNPRFSSSRERPENFYESRQIHERIRHVYQTRHPNVLEIAWGPLASRLKAILAAAQDGSP